MGTSGGQTPSHLSTVASVPLPGGTHVLKASGEAGDLSLHQFLLDDTGAHPLPNPAAVLRGGDTLGTGTLTTPLPEGLELRSTQRTPHATTFILADEEDTECYALSLPHRVWPRSGAEQESPATLIGRHAPELIGTLETRIQRRDYILGTVHRLPCVPNAYDMTRGHVDAQYFSHKHKVLLGQTIRYLHDSLLLAFPYEWVPATGIRRELEERLDNYLHRAPELAPYEDWIRDCHRRLDGELLIQRIHGSLDFRHVWLDDDHWIIGGWDSSLHLPREERHPHGSPLQDLAVLYRNIFWASTSNPSWGEKAITSIFEGYGEPLITLPFNLFVLDHVCAEIAGLATPPESSGSDAMEFLAWYQDALTANLHRMEQSSFHRV